jgi:hypothetical protein
MARIDLKKCTIKIIGGGDGEELEVKIGEGSLEYTEHKAREYFNDRGQIADVRDADEQPMEVNAQFTWEFLRSNGEEAITVEEALKKVGAASEWTTSGDDPCEPYCVDIQVEYDPDCSPTLGEIYYFSEFRYESLGHNFKDATVSFNGKCKTTEATVTRST